MPQRGLARPHRAQGAPTLRGWPRDADADASVRVRYGIESYFVPEGQGRKLEDLAREKKLAALVAVDGRGNAAIKGLIVDGVLQYEEPLSEMARRPRRRAMKAAGRSVAAQGDTPMTIKRHEPSKIYSKVVEANGFVFTAGITADDIKQDVKGQTAADPQGDRPPAEAGGTDKTKVVSATIWVTDIRLRDPMNEAWNAWTGGENLPGRACIEAKLADPRMLVEIAVVAAK